MARTRFHTTLLLAAVAAALAGCSRMPTAPSVETATGRTGSSQGVIQSDDTPATVDGGLANSVTLQVGQAGTIEAGMFTLVIHKNSLKAGATITMTQPDPNVMEVEFEVTPASANDFQVPVKLLANLSGQPLDVVKSETMFWWQGAWHEAADVNLDRDARILSATAHRLVRAKVDLDPKARLETTDN